MARNLTTEQAREMASKVKNQNGGRKRRAEEQEIADALNRAKPEGDVLRKMAEAIERRESWAITLYLAYKWGKPKETKDINVSGRANVVIDVGDNGNPYGVPSGAEGDTEERC